MTENIIGTEKADKPKITVRRSGKSNNLMATLRLSRDSMAMAYIDVQNPDGLHVGTIGLDMSMYGTTANVRVAGDMTKIVTHVLG